jgi:hypothetical protein
MKILNLLIVTLLFFNQLNCQNNRTNNFRKKNTFQEEKLIGLPLSTVDQVEKKLNRKIDLFILTKQLFDENRITITIEKIKDWNDPGDFHSIRIVRNGQESVFFNQYGWDKITYEKEYMPYFFKTNLINSDYIVLQKASEKDLLLFIYGYTYASKPPLLTIINLTRFDKPKVIFNSECSLYAFKDINNDRIIDIEISKSFIEEIKSKKQVEKFLLINGYFVRSK